MLQKMKADLYKLHVLERKKIKSVGEGREEEKCVDEGEVGEETKRGRCVCCGYRKGTSKKYKDTKASNFCVKCDKFVSKSSFEFYHTKRFV